MAMTKAMVGKGPTRCSGLERHVETGSAATLLTATLPAGNARRVHMVTIKYSGAPTQAGTTVTLDSGAGAGYDAVLNTGTANATTTVYFPDGVLVIGKDDALVVAAPSGGGALTASVAIYSELL